MWKAGSRDLGVSWLLDSMWTRVGIRGALESLLSGRDYETVVERLVFSMVLDRAMAPSSKLAMEDWISGEVSVKGLPYVEVHQLYRVLQGAADGYIIGEKIRLGWEGEPAAAVQRAGNYKKLASGLEAKEVIVGGEGALRRRFIVVKNPDETKRDQEKRADIISEATRRLEELNQLKGEPHTKAACALRAPPTFGGSPAFGRYVKQSKTGTLSLDQARIKREARLDGKYLISTSEDLLPVEDVVLAYKNLWRIERLNRDLTHLVDIRPVYHRLEDRIRSHVLLCWLALLLIRMTENETGKTWREIRSLLSGLKVGIHRTGGSEVWQTTPLTPEQKELLSTLQTDPPPKYLSIKAPNAAKA